MRSATCTSQASFLFLQENGIFESQQEEVFKIIKLGGVLTLREIQMAYYQKHDVRLDIGTISARVNKLKKEDRVMKSEKTQKCPISGRTVHPVFVPVID